MNFMKLKDPIILASLLSSLVGLLLIYLAALALKPIELTINEITPELIGRSVTVRGEIIYKRSHPSGHLFLLIADKGKKVQVPIFSSLMNYFEGDDFRKGKWLRVSGVVDEYKGQLQIIPRKPEDIEFLGYGDDG